MAAPLVASLRRLAKVGSENTQTNRLDLERRYVHQRPASKTAANVTRDAPDHAEGEPP